MITAHQAVSNKFKGVENMKKNGNERPEHSGFESPAVGEVFPRGTKFKKNKDGTITPIVPKEKPEKKGK